jgi:acetolactate synthase-1/2/3 large subunit
VDPEELGRNRPLEVGVTAHLDAALRQVCDLVPRDLAPRLAPWLAAVRAREADGRAKLDALARADDVPVSHYRLAAEIARVVTPETIVVGDGGDVVGCAARFVPLHRPGQWLDPGPFGCLGVGPPFALAARLLHPDRPVLLIAGDGAFGLNGMDMETCVRFGAPVVCVVGNDGGWGQIRNPQHQFFGAQREVATSLPVTRYDRMVEALGGRGALLTAPGEIGPALERALASGETWCLNVVLDPAAYRRTGQVSMAI